MFLLPKIAKHQFLAWEFTDELISIKLPEFMQLKCCNFHTNSKPTSNETQNQQRIIFINGGKKISVTWCTYLALWSKWIWWKRGIPALATIANNVILLQFRWNASRLSSKNGNISTLILLALTIFFVVVTVIFRFLSDQYTALLLNPRISIQSIYMHVQCHFSTRRHLNSREGERREFEEWRDEESERESRERKKGERRRKDRLNINSLTGSANDTENTHNISSNWCVFIEFFIDSFNR